MVKAKNDREPTRPVYRGLLDISSPSPLKTHTIVAVLNVTLSLLGPRAPVLMHDHRGERDQLFLYTMLEVKANAGHVSSIYRL